MSGSTLALPGEPRALRVLVRTALEETPETTLPLVVAGQWIADPLWEGWRGTLEARGMSREQFDAVVAGYGNELRLWVVGERPWSQYVSGVAGRVTRRLVRSDSQLPSSEPGATPAWSVALGRVRLSSDEPLDVLVTRIEELRLLHDLRFAAGNGSAAAHAIVWAGGRPRDPEAPAGEGHSAISPAAALAEALGRFLVRDPAYPPRPLASQEDPLILTAFAARGVSGQ